MRWLSCGQGVGYGRQASSCLKSSKRQRLHLATTTFQAQPRLNQMTAKDELHGLVTTLRMAMVAGVSELGVDCEVSVGLIAKRPGEALRIRVRHKGKEIVKEFGVEEIKGYDHPTIALATLVVKAAEELKP